MGMGNLIKYIRYEISHVAQDLSEANAKVRTYVHTIDDEILRRIS